MSDKSTQTLWVETMDRLDSEFLLELQVKRDSLSKEEKEQLAKLILKRLRQKNVLKNR